MTETIDTDALLRQALASAEKPGLGGSSEMDRFRLSFYALSWLEVLAVPHAFSSLERCPSRSQLLAIIDGFLEYAGRGDRGTTPTLPVVHYELREERALRLRRLLEKWQAGALTREIIQAAREVLEAEGLVPPEGWDNLPLPTGRLDDYLLWPPE